MVHLYFFTLFLMDVFKQLVQVSQSKRVYVHTDKTDDLVEMSLDDIVSDVKTQVTYFYEHNKLHPGHVRWNDASASVTGSNIDVLFYLTVEKKNPYILRIKTGEAFGVSFLVPFLPNVYTHICDLAAPFDYKQTLTGYEWYTNLSRLPAHVFLKQELEEYISRFT